MEQYLQFATSAERANESAIHGAWFAIQVRPRHEFVVAKALREKGYEEFLPLFRQTRTWSDRKKIVESPLFSGYVFCRFIAEARGPVVTTPGVIRIVGSQQGPLPVDPAEIANIQRAVHAGFPAEPHPYMPMGTKIMMNSGPLAGVEGIVAGSRNQQIILSINLLQRSVAINLDRSLYDSVTPLASPDCRPFSVPA